MRPGLFPPWRTTLLLAALGAVLGPLFDQIHLAGSVLHYPRPWLFGQPPWVYPQFAMASVAMAGTCQWQLRALGRGDTRGSVEDVERSLAWFLAAYLSSAVFQQWELPLALVLFLLAAARVARGGGWRVGVYAIACALGGTTWEAVVSGLGHFAYDAPRSLLGVPAWLPMLYLHAALFTREASRLGVPAAGADRAVDADLAA